ncbi:MAG: DUF2892 domain-containing protein [Magnetococcus sp. DMHC-1]|nr:DUF2892 domain-containing protein [Magnetococcales bacterium]
MKDNVGTMDRVVRVVKGGVLISLVFVGPKVRWGWLGVYPLLTGLIGTCLFYDMLGFDTKAPKKKSYLIEKSTVS